MIRAILYGTLGCHLCDDAEALLAPLLADFSQTRGTDCEIECVDISTDDALVDRYGVRIPVLQRLSDRAELNWPFDEQQARDFLIQGSFD